MAIDMEREKLLTMSEATAYVPKRNGRKVHSTTIWRWVRYGSKGVFLDGLRTPSGWVTSVEAISRFMVELTRQDLQQNREGWERRQAEVAMSQDHDRAMAKLRARGIVD